MYNIYTFEKRKKQEEEKQIRLNKSKEFIKKRKAQLNILSQNYKQRVRDFITDVHISYQL